MLFAVRLFLPSKTPQSSLRTAAGGVAIQSLGPLARTGLPRFARNDDWGVLDGKNRWIRSLAAGLLLSCSACASIVDGTSQEIVVTTTPAGADCTLVRDGVSVARINPTPGGVTLKKTKRDLTVTCSKPGYQTATFFDKSGTAPATFGNIVLGGLIGWGIDSAAGADNAYTTPINLTLPPITAATFPQSGKAN
jgi:hypothetical protein